MGTLSWLSSHFARWPQGSGSSSLKWKFSSAKGDNDTHPTFWSSLKLLETVAINEATMLKVAQVIPGDPTEA